MQDSRNREIVLGDQIRTNIGLTGAVVMISWSSDYVKVALDGATKHVWIRSSDVTILPNQQPES